MSEGTNRPFNTPPGLIVPANARQIVTPVAGSGEIVVSELIPTVCITPSFPQKGVTTYAEMPYINNTWNADAYAGFIYQRAEREYMHSNMTRLYFSNGAIDSTTPYDTVWTSDVMTWPAVLEFFQTFRNTTAPIKVTIPNPVGGPNSVLNKFIPRFTVVYGLRRSVSGHCKMRIDKYVSNTAFDLSGTIFEMFQTSDVMWDMPGTSGSIERCLHDLVKVRAARDNIDWTSDTPRYMVFPATDLLEWKPISWIEVQMADVLYTKFVYTIYPPTIPEVSVYVE